MESTGIESSTAQVDSMASPVVVTKPKRGRRSKKEIAEMKEKEMKDKETSELNQGDSEENVVIIPKPPPKKRGRKPKGGKIVEEEVVKKETFIRKPNIMLHLKCSTSDLECKANHESDFSKASVDSYDANDLNYHSLNNNITPGTQTTHTNFQCLDHFKTDGNSMDCVGTVGNASDMTCNTDCEGMCMQSDTMNVKTKDLWKKLKSLEHLLHNNSLPDSKSACFWCSHDFDNPPIYIPKFFIKESYQVYGCFCTPECAVAYLMKENIDSSCKFERYNLLNSLYNKIFEYSKNIKPAPDPHYLLEKFCGNLTIQEYRKLLKSDRLFLVVDKPLTRVLPELHEDNDEFIINNKIIPTSNNYNLKKKKTGLNKAASQTGENFGIFNMVA